MCVCERVRETESEKATERAFALAAPWLRTYRLVSSLCELWRRKLRQRIISSVVLWRRKPRAIRISSVVDCRRMEGRAVLSVGGGGRAQGLASLWATSKEASIESFSKWKAFL